MFPEDWMLFNPIPLLKSPRRRIISVLTILVSYSEIALKSRQVRSQLERRLADQIGFMLRRAGYTGFTVHRRFGRIIVEDAPEEAASTVARVFGVVSAMPSTRVEPDLSSVVQGMANEAVKSVKPGEGFAVRARVVGTHGYGSTDVCVEGGSKVLELMRGSSVHVNLDEPDVTIYVEVRDNNAYIYSRIIPGVKGLPYGSQGRAVALFSGGIDSPVAAWLMMKRGVETLPLFMNQTPYVGTSYLDRARMAFRALAAYTPVEKFSLYAAPMGPVMERILESPEPRFTCVLCKRSMYRIAELFAEREKARAIVTGESLGQVASQTLENIYVLDHAVLMPVLRPIVGLDKVDIEAMARNIGTYEVTAKTVEGCKAVPSKPSTASRLKKIEALEEELNLVSLCAEVAERVHIMDEA
jgi:thiamine biosynthesis protein ThiI